MAKTILAVLVLALMSGITGCQPQNQNTQSTQDTKNSTQTVAQTTQNQAPNEQGVSVSITGAGASFPQPIYAKWSSDFHASTGGQVNYQSIGSSGGIKQIIAKTVDFGASDAPLSADELNKEGLVQFPTVMGGVVPVVNIEGVSAGALKLDGQTLANIYLGKISKWNDPAIVALNPELSLPDAPITTVFRSDGSGTTFNFTDYLSKVSDDFKNSVGVDKTVKWPTASTGVAGKGNEGVANYVSRMKNAIGYVEYAYAKQNKMSHIRLKNATGDFVEPSVQSFAAAGDIDWSKSPSFDVVLTNSPAKNAWPISAATFILVHKNPQNPKQVADVLAFFDWAYTQDDSVVALDYVPFSDNAKSLFRQSWQAITADNKPVYTSTH